MSFLSGIFGGNQVQAPHINSVTPSFNGGGLSGTGNANGNYTVTPDANRTAQVGDLSNTYSQLGDQYGNLLKTVAPGYNDLLNSRLTQFNNNAASSIGTLNQNLQSRRVLGSSFGQDTITRAQNQIAQQRDAITSDNFLQSLNASNQLLGQQYDAYSKAFQNNLNELNLEAGIANQMSTNTANILNQNARTQAQLQQQASQANAANNTNLASGFGSFLGKMIPGAASGAAGGITIPTAVADLGFIGL